jgi:hypothetical protein
VAGHNYGGTPAPVPQAQGKELWETETSSTETFDPGIGNALRWASNIHDFMTVAHADAWHYWWIKSSGNDDAGLLGPNWQLTKRFWAVGNYSKFVRPGWVDIGATDDGGVLVSAYKDPVSGRFTIVAVNPGSAVTKTFNLHGFVTRAVTPWVTSADLDLAQQDDIAVRGAGFTADLPAQSVTTFVGAAALDIGSPSEVSADVLLQGGWGPQPGPHSGGFGQVGLVNALADDGLRSAGYDSTTALLGSAFSTDAYPGAAALVSTPGHTGALVAGMYGLPAFLGTTIRGDQASLTFTIHAADRTTDLFTRDFSDWSTGLSQES